MAEITKQTMYGDLEVSRNLITGGRLDVTGKASFGGNVKVEGFLDAPNLKVPFKGVFESDTTLAVAYPAPHNGWYAYVKTVGDSTAGTDTYYIMRAYGLKWVSTGETGTLEVDTDIEKVEALVEEIKDDVGEIKSMASENKDDIASLKKTVADLDETINGEDGDSGLVGSVEGLVESMNTAEANINKKLNKTDVYNGLDQTETGKALDATQGKVLDEKIQKLADSIESIVGDGTEGSGTSLTTLQALITLLQNGKWGGSIRFNGLTELGKSTLVEGMFAGESIEGIIWLTDKKMFVACDAQVKIDCGCEKVIRTYYTDWDGSRFFMKTPGKAGGLWKEKIYIHNGALYVWKQCEKQLVKASGTNDNILTNEEIDEIMEDFQFVEIGNPLYKIEAKGDTLLYLDAEQNGGEALVKGKVDIKDVTEKDVLKMFADAEKKLNE